MQASRFGTPVANFGRKAVGRRVAVRSSAPLPGFFTTRSRSGSAVLLDLSCTGARMRGELLPDRGEELVIAAGGVSVFATVAWSLAGECGVTFDSSLPPDVVAHIRTHAAEQGDVAPELAAARDDWLAR